MSPAGSPRVSVVMPVCDVAPYVDAALRGVLAQTFVDFELIVIDDGSTDGTAEIVEAVDDPRIRVVHTTHAGYVAAQDMGLALARGEYVLRADGDDLFLPRLLERQVEVLDREPSTVAVGAWARQFGARQRFRPAPTEPSAIRRRLRWANALSQPVMFRASAAREVGGFRQVRWEDWDLWLRLAARYDLRNIPECLVLLRSRSDSTYWTFSRKRAREAVFAMRRTAWSELGPSLLSASAVTAGAVGIVRGAVLDRLTPRRRPGPSSPTPPSFSVVVPTFQRPVSLLRCLEAVEAQEPAPTEVVVVARPDDASTARALAPWAEAAPDRRRVIAVDRPGLVPALTAGTRAARCEAIAYLDDDAVPASGWLAELGLGFLDPTVGAVGGRLVDHVDGVERTGRTDRVGIITWYGRVIGRHHLATERYGDVEWLTGSNLAVRASLARHDERLAHTVNGLALANDLDTCLEVRRAGHRVLYSPWARVDHYTTSFRDPMLGTRIFGADVETSAANHTYALLKYLPPPRRAAFLIYGFVVGQASVPGPLRAAAEVVTSPARARAMAARIPSVWKGRREGIRMWRAWRSGAEEAVAEGKVVA